MILAWVGVALILFVGIGGFTLALCRSAKDGDRQMADAEIRDVVEGAVVLPVRPLRLVRLSQGPIRQDVSWYQEPTKDANGEAIRQ